MRMPNNCPFCGESPTIHEGAGAWYIDCTNDYCPVEPQLKEPAYNREEAIRLWNIRSEPLNEETLSFIQHLEENRNVIIDIINEAFANAGRNGVNK